MSFSLWNRLGRYATLAGLGAALVSPVSCKPNTQASKPAAEESESAKGPIVVIDGTGDTVVLEKPALRVISLLASGTESLIALGASDLIVGRTIYDKAPEVSNAKLVGTGLEPNLETLLSLKPDLIIGWTAEKRQKLHIRLKDAGIKVYNLATQDTSDIYNGIKDLSRLIGKDTSGIRLLAEIRAELDGVRKRVATMERRRVLYVVSIEPPITANAKTYVSQIIGVAGGDILFPTSLQNWPTVSLEEIALRNPEFIILPVGEFKRNAIERLRVLPGWRDLDAVKKGNVIAIDADLINRPGPNIGKIALHISDSIYKFHHTR